MRSQSGRRAQSEPVRTVDTVVARKWLKDRGVTGTCPLCQSADLKVSKDFFTTLGIQSHTGAPDLGAGSLFVRLRCGHCAHLMFFHAKQMGLLD